jgi:hypothetical protein
MGRRLPVADEFWLAAHHDVSGKPRQHPRSVGLGLAGALLGELVLAGRVTVDRAGLVRVVGGSPPGDAVAHVVLDELLADPAERVLREWLAYLGQTAGDRVAARLERQGQVRRVEVRRLLRVESRWVPVDSTVAATPGSLLRYQLFQERPLAPADALLAGLVDATGLTPGVLWGVPHRTLQYRDWCVSRLTPPLRAVISETAAAVGGSVLAHRS